MSPSPAAPTFSLKPTHKAITGYYTALAQFASVGARHETAVREAWHNLIEACAGPLKWVLVAEYNVSRPGLTSLRIDAALIDQYRIPHGYLEDKDDDDDLQKEMLAKLKLGYPAKNILFWQPRRALLVQNGKVKLNLTLDKPENLVELLTVFFTYREEIHTDWERAVEEFKERVPELGRSVQEIIHRDRTGPVPSKKFVAAFNDFAALCRSAINPGLADAAIEEMLIQHLLTVRLFSSVFNNPEFTRRNIIAIEIEKVIDALASRHFDRREFLKKLDRFYLAIESAATTIEDFSEKQKFLNTVYEKFFQGFAVKVADTMGIVYTPPSIVRFMIASIRELLKKEFAKDLGADGVHFLDPFTGTGNFLVHLLRELPAAGLKRKFAGELWANEIMLLPYYIAAQNIEHEYFEKIGTYEAFPGLCLVDTFELAEPHGETMELTLDLTKNTERVNAQKKAPIRVILGNPPYNANQQDENDNNKNRKYPRLDQRIRNTYAADSEATLLNKLSDPYIKAIRWASDRIGDEGIVAYVSNSGYLETVNSDGVRKHLAADFDDIYLVDLGGNVRKNPKLSGTTHNVFGIQVGVSIAFFIRHKQKELKSRHAIIRYVAVGEDWRKEQKWRWLEEKEHIGGVKWKTLKPDAKHTWLREGLENDFDTFLSMGTKETKARASLDAHAIFRTYSLGISTNRDAVVYDFDPKKLGERVESFCDAYNAEVVRYRQKKPADDKLDEFLKTERVKWSETLKRKLVAEELAEYDETRIKRGTYRPFTMPYLYFDPFLIDRPGSAVEMFPGKHKEEIGICVPTLGARADFWAFACRSAPNLNLMSLDAAQCFSLYTYADDGSHRRDNITDWALEQFKVQYLKTIISKKDIFHYVYAVLHHPVYRDSFAANLRRELPRIPFAPDFAAFAKAGERLAALHTGYESQKEFKLKRVETKGVKPDWRWRVERMKLSKDKSELVYNDWLTLKGIPKEVSDYRLGNRSALDWVIDQYRVEHAKDDPDTTLSDPNRPDDEEYIVRLIGQVVTVSVETMKLVHSLPTLGAGTPKAATYNPQAEADAAHHYLAKEDPPAPAG